MESKVRSECILDVTWTSKALLDYVNVHKSMSFLKTFKRCKCWRPLKYWHCAYVCKILQCTKPRAVALNVVLLQVKPFCLVIFQIFETSVKESPGICS